eukprot:Phypoly_transcript_15944.p1 GENE.Phypoly_transcript_15944~~Phypoly_transcript_15944.p1  ORF type:complete len:231 (+),score=31.47 Phypoly_transcript_15944:105-797(+)
MDDYTAFRQSLALAVKGDLYAQTRTGSYYLVGRGVEKDVSKAVEWHTKASNAGGTSWECRGAQYNMGYIYLDGGNGVQKDAKKAIEWFHIALQNTGMTPEMISEVYHTMGVIYFSGEDGVPRDEIQAEAHFLKSIEIGSQIEAYYYLGKMYSDSNNEMKKRDSIKYFHLGADKGCAGCMFSLGQAYMIGNNVPYSSNLAEQWLEKAYKLDQRPVLVKMMETLKRIKDVFV